jgi:hypothetical protein
MESNKDLNTNIYDNIENDKVSNKEKLLVENINSIKIQSPNENDNTLTEEGNTNIFSKSKISDESNQSKNKRKKKKQNKFENNYKESENTSQIKSEINSSTIQNKTSSESQFKCLDSLTHSSCIKEESLTTISNINDFEVVYAVSCKIHRINNISLHENQVICFSCGNSKNLEELKPSQLKLSNKLNKLSCDSDGKEALFFCIDCDIFCCKVCFAKKHKVHKSNLLSNISEKILKENENRQNAIPLLLEKIELSILSINEINYRLFILKSNNLQKLKAKFDLIFVEYRKFVKSLQSILYSSILETLELNSLKNGSNESYRSEGGNSLKNYNSYDINNPQELNIDKFFKRIFEKLNHISELTLLTQNLVSNLRLDSTDNIKYFSIEFKKISSEIEKISTSIKLDLSKEKSLKVCSASDSQCNEIIKGFNKNKNKIDNVLNYFSYSLSCFTQSANHLFKCPADPKNFFIRRFDSFSNEDQVNFLKSSSLAIQSKETIFIKGVSLCGLRISERNRLRIISGDLDPKKLEISIQIEVREAFKECKNFKTNNESFLNNINSKFDKPESDNSNSFISKKESIVDTENTKEPTNINSIKDSNEEQGDNNNNSKFVYHENLLICQKGFLKPILNPINPVFTIYFDDFIECTGMSSKEKTKTIIITVRNLSNEDYLNIYTGTVLRYFKDSNVQIIFYEANSNKQVFTNIKQRDISQLNPFICFSSKHTESDFVEIQKGIISDIIYSK